MIELLHCDCMEYMRGLPDKAFDLTIVDIPYGLGEKLTSGEHGRKNTTKVALRGMCYQEKTISRKFFAFH